VKLKKALESTPHFLGGNGEPNGSGKQAPPDLGGGERKDEKRGVGNVIVRGEEGNDTGAKTNSAARGKTEKKNTSKNRAPLSKKKKNQTGNQRKTKKRKVPDMPPQRKEASRTEKKKSKSPQRSRNRVPHNQTL